MSATLLLNSRQAEVVLLFRLHVKPLVHLLMQQPVVLQYRIVRYLLLNRDVPVIDIRSIVLYWCAAVVCCSTITTATHQYNTILSLIYDDIYLTCLTPLLSPCKTTRVFADAATHCTAILNCEMTFIHMACVFQWYATRSSRRVSCKCDTTPPSSPSKTTRAFAHAATHCTAI